jgi:hypothetical protein
VYKRVYIHTQQYHELDVHTHHDKVVYKDVDNNKGLYSFKLGGVLWLLTETKTKMIMGKI